MVKYSSLFFIILTSCFFISRRSSDVEKEYLYLLYQNYYNFSEFEKAEKTLKKLINLYPEKRYIEEYVRLLYSLKKYKDVIEIYKIYREKIPLSREFLTYIMGAALIIGDEKTYQSLKNYFLTFATLNEKDGIFLVNMELLKSDKKEALNIINLLLEKFKDSEGLLRLKAEILIEMGRYGEGIDILESFQKKEEKDMMLLGRAYNFLNNHDKALFYLLKVDSLRKNDPGIKRAIVDILIEKGDFLKADSMTDVLLNIKPLSPEYLRLKGYIKYERKDYPEALKNLLLAIELNPGDDLSYYYLSRVYYRLNKSKKALSCIKKAIQINPKAIDYINYKIFLLIVNKNYREALLEIRRNLRKYPDDPGINYLAGFLFSEIGKKKKAVEFYKKSIRYDSLNPAKWFELGALYESLDMVKEAEKCFEKVTKLDSLNASAYNYWGYMLAERGIKLEFAKKLIEKAVSLSPGNGYYLDSLGWVYFQMGEYEKAREILLQAVSLEPNDPVILEHCGDVFMKMGEIEKAKEFYRKAFKLNPKNKKILKKIEE